MFNLQSAMSSPVKASANEEGKTSEVTQWAEGNVVFESIVSNTKNNLAEAGDYVLALSDSNSDHPSHSPDSSVLSYYMPVSYLRTENPLYYIWFLNPQSRTQSLIIKVKQDLFQSKFGSSQAAADENFFRVLTNYFVQGNSKKGWTAKWARSASGQLMVVGEGVFDYISRKNINVQYG